MRVEIAVGEPFVLGESPFWDEDGAALWWVDIRAPAIHRWSPASGAARGRARGRLRARPAPRGERPARGALRRLTARPARGPGPRRYCSTLMPAAFTTGVQRSISRRM